MKKYRFKIYLAVMAGSLLYVACRKNDFTSFNSVTRPAQTFFDTHRSSSPVVQQAADYIRHLDEKHAFVQKLVAKSGWAWWDKSVVFDHVTNAPSLQRNAGGDSATIVYIPLIRPGERIVNTTLMVKMTAEDTVSQLLHDYDYVHFGFDSTAGNDWHARDVFNVFGLMNHAVFGYTRYNITDSRIYGDSGVEGMRATINFEEVPPSTNLWASFTICTYTQVCIIAENPTPLMNQAGSFVQPAGVCHTYPQCTIIWVDMPDANPVGSGNGDTGSNGSSGGNSTGGDSGGGSGSGSGTGGDGPGWVPIDDSGGSATPPNDSTIAEGLKRLLMKAGNAPDSLHRAAQEDGLERTFTFIRRPNGDTTIAWIKEGGTHESFPTLTGYSIAFFHTHQEDDPVGGSDKNQCFDGPDIYKLYKNAAIDEYPLSVSFLSTRDYYYAFIITDLQLFKRHIQTICSSADIRIIPRKMNDIHIDAMDECVSTTCTWQVKTELGALAISANNDASVSGVKIFRSPKNNINFTLLTP